MHDDCKDHAATYANHRSTNIEGLCTALGWRHVSESAVARAATGGGSAARLQLLSSFLTPLTVLTGLLVYVGWVRTRAFYDWFGVKSGLLGFSPQDLTLQSADVGSASVFVLALVCCALVTVDWVISLVLAREELGVWGRRIRLGLAGVGIVLVVVALLTARAYAVIAAVPPIAGAGLLALGATMLLRFGAGVPGRPAPLPRAAAVVGVLVLALSAFWAATTYARTLGTGAARDLAADPGSMPLVTIYSEKPIDLSGGSLVTAARVPNSDGGPTYRYTGPRLLTYSNDRWFLVTDLGEAGYRPAVVVVHDEEAVRVETRAPA
ncbi:hypothetical protein GCM10010472_71290 [Pseudonocardia halophobica]|uniref:Uncharacterized protein n=1 Tax=Pseudonocardia halophobica TaxID=29401 RepID=A0A9W6L2E7_9PSEU|nr:hypothetical protein [Pseudonocardia halophobica]GLL10999.1 hypothetical protein GCM10017577_21400 [Pseudonocardia halophobica]